MNDPGRRVPASAQLDAVGTRELGDAVVAGFIGEQALAHLLLGAVGVEAKVGGWQGTLIIVVLRREIVGLRLAQAADLGGVLKGEVQVVEQRHSVVKKLGIHWPAAEFFHHFLAHQYLSELVNRVFEEKPLVRRRSAGDIAHALVRRSQGAVVRRDGAAEPAFLHTAAYGPQREVIVRVKAEPVARAGKLTGDKNGN